MNKLLILLIAYLVYMPCLFSQMHKKRYPFPDAGEYKVLKCDFHQHTIFSDGQVWPRTRVLEAWDEDLDAIALSEHIEYRRFLDDISSRDHNRSWELAKDAAKTYDVILIKSAEITRGMPPGHLNVIGIKDANAFEKFVNKKLRNDSTNISAALSEAKKQGGFIIWNHPAYPTKDNKSTWHPKHEELKNAGLINAIEIVNGERYEAPAFQWCIDYDLAIIANTDVHSTMAQKRAHDHSKVMTLVLAKDRSEDAIMEALFEKRTAAVWDDKIMGRENVLKPIIINALDIRFKRNNGDQGLIEIENMSGLPFKFEVLEVPNDLRFRNDVPIVAPALEVAALEGNNNIKDASLQNIKIKVLNAFVAPKKNLIIDIPVKM